jgi:membrane fusion protein (multidrug efflux system)
MVTPSLLYQGDKIPAHQLTEFGFEAEFSVPPDSVAAGSLALGSSQLDVQFRVRGKQGARSACSFVDLSLKQAAILRKFVADQERGFLTTSSLEEKTYDELAAGKIDSADSTETAPTKTAPAKTGAGVKAFALFAIVLVILLLAVGSLFFLKSRSSLAVNNSSLSGNYIPVNSSVDGEIIDVLIQEGQFVAAGDILFRLRNPDLEIARDDLVAQHVAASRKVRALQDQMRDYQKTISATTKRLQLDVKLSQAEVDTAGKQLEAARATVNRLRPYVSTGAVTPAEVEIAQKQYLVAEAALNTAKSQLDVRSYAFSAASNDNIIFVGGRVDTEPNQLASEIAIAKADLETLAVSCELANRRIDELVVRAPRTGQVHVNYRHVGEFLRASEQVIALSVGGNVWAAGHVATSQATRIRPGQPVKITVPSSGESLQGVVSAVGHRSLYGKGGYTAEFRGSTATDVPVKVTIPNLPEQLPSGIRLDMVINTGFGVKWIDEFFDYELQPVNQPLAPPAIPPAGPALGPAEQITDDEPVVPKPPTSPSLPTVAGINER